MAPPIVRRGHRTIPDRTFDRLARLLTLRAGEIKGTAGSADFPIDCHAGAAGAPILGRGSEARFLGNST
jgi:hypothetical protein